MNSGRESEIVAVFCRWLQDHGWTAQTEVGWIDVLAERGDERLIAEAKGLTAAPGLDVDTMYGQLLRRMTLDPGTRYGVVVPEKLIPVASRVSVEIRARLGIRLYGIDADDVVREH